MKKLLVIVVLGLLFCGSGYAEVAVMQHYKTGNQYSAKGSSFTYAISNAREKCTNANNGVMSLCLLYSVDNKIYWEDSVKQFESNCKKTPNSFGCEKFAEKPKKQEPSKKEIVYETITKAEPTSDSSMISTSFRIKRTYYIEKGSNYSKYLRYVLDDSMKNCEAKREHYGACIVVSVKYFEINNPSNNSKVFNTNGVTVNNIQVGWNGIKNGTPIIAEKPKKPKTSPDDNKVVVGSSGSGFFVSKEGHLITNFHVIDRCDNVKINFKGDQLETKILAVDKVNDIAILKTNFIPSNIFPVSNIDVSLLEDIIVAGFPKGKKISSAIKTSKGVVTALAGAGDNYSEFQTDTVINAGNSGGPIINQKGNIVGIAVSSWIEEGVEGIHFGIKSSTLKTFANANGLKFLPPNNRDLSNKDLGQLITEATLYLECHLTIAKLKKMIAEANNRKAFFSEYR